MQIIQTISRAILTQVLGPVCCLSCRFCNFYSFDGSHLSLVLTPVHGPSLLVLLWGHSKQSLDLLKFIYSTCSRCLNLPCSSIGARPCPWFEEPKHNTGASTGEDGADNLVGQMFHGNKGNKGHRRHRMGGPWCILIPWHSCNPPAFQWRQPFIDSGIEARLLHRYSFLVRHTCTLTMAPAPASQQSLPQVQPRSPFKKPVGFQST